MARPQPTTPPALGPGDVIGEFGLDRKVGESKLGVLFLGVRRRDRLPVAVRVVPAEVVRDDANWARFVEVSRAAWHHDRRHVAPLVGHGSVPDGGRFAAFALPESRLLLDHLREQAIEPAEWLSVLRGVCRALDATHHEGIFHGTLELSNVAVGSDREGRTRATVFEFGAGVLLDHSRPRSGPVAKAGGDFQSIEISRDLRLLGQFCFESLTGEAFTESVEDGPARVSDFRPELGPHFDEVVHALMMTSGGSDSAGAAHARLLDSARRAGYDVGSAIPSAPREARDGAATSKPPSPKARALAVDEALGLIGPAMFGLALLGLILVLFGERCASVLR